MIYMSVFLVLKQLVVIRISANRLTTATLSEEMISYAIMELFSYNLTGNQVLT